LKKINISGTIKTMNEQTRSIVLAIETSCDETCVALIEAKGTKSPKFKILSDIVSSQVKIHRKWGGVYPTLAKREHQKNLPLVLKKACKKAGNPQVDLLAVTVGPGLEPCLWVGINFAKQLSKELKKPIISVNHIEAHIYANWLNKKPKRQIFPAICLIVSGGHTQLILMKGHGQYKILGETRDDAAGECFDKVARILGLGYPGGPEVEAEASKLKGEDSKLEVKLPRPMIYHKNYDFSFSGLKTAVLYNYKNQTKKIRESKKYIRFMCAETQQAIIDVLLYKTLRAAREHKVKAIILGGGVTANQALREQFKKTVKKEFPTVSYLVPDKSFCTDNGTMTGVAGFYQWQREGKKKRDIEANANLRLE